jgi:hypothetical protein
MGDPGAYRSLIVSLFVYENEEPRTMHQVMIHPATYDTVRALQ